MSQVTGHQSHVKKIKQQAFHLCLVTCVLFTFGIKPAYAGTSEIEAAIMEKNYTRASELANAILKSSHNSKERVHAQYYWALSQLRLKRYAQARNAFQIVMSSADTQDLYDRAALGMIEGLYLPGFYRESLKEAEAFLRKSPKSSFLSLLYLKMARIHLKLTHWDQAREYLQKVLNEFPDSLEAPLAQNLMEEKEYFTVQVGAFMDQERAIKMAENLKTHGQYAYIVETMIDKNKKFYRVRVGQLTSLSDAQGLEVQLSQKGYPTLIYP